MRCLHGSALTNMLRPHQTFGFVVLLAAILVPVGPSVAQSPANASANAAHKKKFAAKKSAPAAEVPQAPAAPPTLEQQPPVPPQVSYRDGQLSITSMNATLAQVLRSVQTQTGATIDMPPGGGSERVVATLGPGKPQAVLASLLNGSKFDYVILGVPNNPGTVQRVILLPKSASSGSEPPAMTAQNVARQQQQQVVEPPEDEYPPNEPEAENPTPMQPGVPGLPGSENMQLEQTQPGNRTPEQMLQELQRMQQQQQQMQQQLNPSNQQQPFGTPYNPNSQPQQQQQSPFPNQSQPSPQPQ